MLQKAADCPARLALRGRQGHCGRDAPFLRAALPGLRSEGTFLPVHGRKEQLHCCGTAAELLSKWFDAYDRLQLPEFSACRRMLKNWKPYILNAFDCSYSNAFTEGCNNAIKALKRVAFGFRNFSNFRARILQAANPAHPNF